MTSIGSFARKTQNTQNTYVFIAQRCREGYKPDEPSSYDGFPPLLKLMIDLGEKWPGDVFPNHSLPTEPELFGALQIVARMEAGNASDSDALDALGNLLWFDLHVGDPYPECDCLDDDDGPRPEDIETAQTTRAALDWVVAHPDEVPEDALAAMDKLISDMEHDGRLPGNATANETRSPGPQAAPMLARQEQPPVPAADQNALRIFKNTDSGNAERLVSRHGAVILYCHPQKIWYVYDNTRWAPDRQGKMMLFAKDIARALYGEAFQITDDSARKKCAEWALKSESTDRKKAALVSAQSEKGIPILPEQFDADNWLLNCPNGTIDLKTGDLREHRREDLITKLAPVQYASTSRSALWQRFLDETTDGNQELQEFLQRAVGYSLTGSVSEEKLFFVHGPGGSGKSTFLEAIKAVLGDYAKTTDFESFVQRSQAGGVRDDIAELAGRRFVVSIEVDEGKKLAEGLTKLLTGGDTVRARLLYQQGFEFMPQFKLWLAANHEPKVKHDDTAMWRRILRVPFDQVVPKEKRDPSIKARLKDVRESGPAILAWCVEGCLRWQEEGLGVPAVVEDATEQYRLDMDPLKDFIADCCVLHESAWITIGKLRKAYEDYCKERGEKHPLTPNQFAAGLQARRCESKRRHAGAGWHGIGLLADETTAGIM